MAKAELSGILGHRNKTNIRKKNSLSPTVQGSEHVVHIKVNPGPDLTRSVAQVYELAPGGALETPQAESRDLRGSGSHSLSRPMRALTRMSAI